MLEVIFGVYTPLQAKLLEEQKLTHAWVSGFGIAGDHFALPDLNVISYTEKLEAQGRIIDAANLNFIVDIDNGIDNPLAFTKYLNQLGRHNPFGVCVEDEAHPKVSALYEANDTLVSDQEFIDKISFIQNHFGGKVFARTNSIVRGMGEDFVRNRVAKIASETNVENIVLHGNRFDLISKIVGEFSNKKSFYLITSLCPSTPLSVFEDIGLSGVILGHTLFFETVHFQDSLVQQILAQRSAPATHPAGKLIATKLISREAGHETN